MEWSVLLRELDFEENDPNRQIENKLLVLI